MDPQNLPVGPVFPVEHLSTDPRCKFGRAGIPKCSWYISTYDVGGPPPAYPPHDSFADTLDEDEYSIVSGPCTGSFSFTLHPEEYQSLGHSSDEEAKDDSDSEVDEFGSRVPVSSVSIRPAPVNHAQDIGHTWVSEGWLAEHPEGTPIPPRCAALLSLATSVDDALDHISTLYRHRDHFDSEIVAIRSGLRTHTSHMVEKINALWDRVTQRISFATGSDLDDRVSSIIETQTRPIQQALSDFDQQLRDLSQSITSRMDSLERRQAGQEDALSALTARMSSFESSLAEHRTLVDSEFVVMDSRIAAIPIPPPDVPLSKSGRASLTAFEKSVKKRLSDHAAKLADNLHRKRESVTSAVGDNAQHRTADNAQRQAASGSHSKAHADGGQPPNTAGWSVASDSQYSQDAPADHEGLPRPLRGGGGGGSLSGSPSRSSHSGSGPSSPTHGADQQSPVLGGTSSAVMLDPGQSQQAPAVSSVEPSRAPRFPTPWANASFYARNNPVLDRTSQQDLPVSNLGPDGQAPPEVHLHGCTYTRKGVDFKSQVDSNAPSLPPDALSVTPMGKVWHGGGSLGSFGTGERVLSREAISSLGVPFSVIPAVLAAHTQLFELWNRSQSGYSQDRYLSYDSSSGRSPSYLQSDALKFQGWTELPQSGVTPEKWVEFYTSLQLMALQYGIGLMPFEGLDLQYAQGGHAFCLCGLGYRVFRQMGSSLFLIIQKLLPTTDPQVVSKVQSVAQSGGDGFELLWLLTKHFVPMVSVTRQLTWPMWPNNDDIFLFARRVALYCNLSRMRGQTPLTEIQRSEMFLSRVEGVHRERAQHLLTTLRVSVSTSPDGHLSPDLRLHLHDLAERLMEEFLGCYGRVVYVHGLFATSSCCSSYSFFLAPF